MKPRLIIVSPRQYGYQTDYLKYVEYLPEVYCVVFLCVDQGEQKFECDNADIRYIKFVNLRLSYLWFIIYTIFYVAFHSGKVMTTNFSGCRYLKRILFWRKMIVNIRTVSVEKDIVKASIQNERIRRDALPFDRIIMISKGGAEQLRLPMDKVDIVGLGSDVISKEPKTYERLHLLYVGTLCNRDIPKTVMGFHNYLMVSGDTHATYDIVGDGDELDEIKHYVSDNQLEKQIFIHGRVRYNELRPFFDRCNIGVSFVPITEAYNHQPPTKTYEYINSGLFTIATNNQVHRETVIRDCGILIDDTVEAFCKALYDINSMKIDERSVRNCGVHYLWEPIVMNDLVASLEA